MNVQFQIEEMPDYLAVRFTGPMKEVKWSRKTGHQMLFESVSHNGRLNH